MLARVPVLADYTVWNTSVLSVVLAGNSTLVVETDSCPEEGCQGLSLEITTKATFKWSDNASWVSVLEATLRTSIAIIAWKVRPMQRSS